MIMTSRDGHINNNTESHDNTEEKMSGSQILKQELDVSQGREIKTNRIWKHNITSVSCIHGSTLCMLDTYHSES